MKNKTIKKLTKGIVAIALTIATVVGAGVIGAQEYNAYTTGSNSCGAYVNELADATGNYNYRFVSDEYSMKIFKKTFNNYILELAAYISKVIENYLIVR